MSLWGWLWQEGGAVRAGSCRSSSQASSPMAACQGMDASKEVSASSQTPINKTSWTSTQKPPGPSIRWRPAEHQQSGPDLPEPQRGCWHAEGQRRFALGPATGAGGQHVGGARPRWAAAPRPRQWLWCQLVPIVGHVAGPAQVRSALIQKIDLRNFSSCQLFFPLRSLHAATFTAVMRSCCGGATRAAGASASSGDTRKVTATRRFSSKPSF